MSTTATARPTASAASGTSQDDCPTEIIPIVAPLASAPTRRPILRAAGVGTGAPSSPFAGWRDAARTELLPAVPAVPSARPRVSTPAKPTSGRVAASTPSRRPSPGTKGLRRRHPRPVRHLRAALAGLLIAAALLTGLQLYAAAGISSGRQAALAQRDAAQAAQSAPAPAAQPEVSSDIQADWVTEQTHAPFDRTDPAASPLDLPRCTTSPDTPLPCLATISPSQNRAVVLEEDASLTALVRQ